jgi:hypothetical protein
VLSQLERVFERKFNLIIDPPIELITTTLNRNYLLSIEHVNRIKKSGEKVLSYFLNLDAQGKQRCSTASR